MALYVILLSFCGVLFGMVVSFAAGFASAGALEGVSFTSSRA